MQMISVTVENEQGLHARPAKMFINEAKKFESDIRIRLNGKEINGKSILELLSLGVSRGTEITIAANGNDEKEATTKLAEFIRNNLE